MSTRPTLLRSIDRSESDIGTNATDSPTIDDYVHCLLRSESKKGAFRWLRLSTPHQVRPPRRSILQANVSSLPRRTFSHQPQMVRRMPNSDEDTYFSWPFSDWQMAAVTTSWEFVNCGLETGSHRPVSHPAAVRRPSCLKLATANGMAAELALGAYELIRSGTKRTNSQRSGA